MTKSRHTFTIATLALLVTSTLIGCAHDSSPKSTATTPAPTPLGQPGSGEPFLAHDASSPAPAHATPPEQSPTPKTPPTSPTPSPEIR